MVETGLTAPQTDLEGRAGDDLPLPAMRQDLEVIDGWPTHGGAPTWMLFDPLRNRYFRIDQFAFQLLSQWAGSTVGAIKEAVERNWHRSVDDKEVSDLIAFLFVNQLTVDPPRDGYRAFAAQEAARHRGVLHRMLHGYLFFKLPLVRPDRFLAAAYPLVAPLMSRKAALFFIFAGLVSLYLVSRQWDAFQGHLQSSFSLRGLIYYVVGLIFVKMVHELGHAFMAKGYGLKVPVIGLAFLVLMPILFTDTSNAWRLRSRRQRLMIDGAGIMSELVLAVMATLLWVFLPDGPLRDVAFSIAAVSWVLSLLVNLNPFMRFDGYYILSDMLGFENLQERGFAMARWKLRETLFGLGVPKPELLSPRLELSVILHAWGTWIYRFALFVGIALLVYSFFVKVVAIFLFIVEIVWFIGLPIYREIKVWWTMRASIIATRRFCVTFGLFLIGLGAACLPLSSKVVVPALMHSAQEVTVYPPGAAWLEKIHVRSGDHVAKGDVLAVFSSDKLELEQTLELKRIALLERRIARGTADARDGALRRVLISQLQTARGKLDGLKKQSAELILVAPQAGEILDFDPQVHHGRMLARSHALLKIRGEGGAALSGLVREDDVERLAVPAAGMFIPDDPGLAKIDVTLQSLAATAVAQLPDPELAEIYGGSAPAKKGSRGELIAMGSFYPVVLSPDQPVSVTGQTLRGVVHLTGERRSFAGRIARRVAGVLIRESGF